MNASRPFSALSLAILSLLVLVLPLRRWHADLPPAAAAGSPPEQSADAPPPSVCSPTSEFEVGPKAVPAGETVAVTLSVRSGCPDRTPPVHMALIVDGSAERGDINVVKEQVSDWIEWVVKASHPRSQVTLIEFTGSARRVCAFTNDREVALDCVNRLRLGSSAASRTDRGIKLAVDEFARARPSASAQVSPREAFVVWTNAADEECSAIEREAQSAARKGVRFSARCVSTESSQCDDRCVARVRDHSETLEVSYVQPKRVPPIQLDSLRITTTFPANIEYVARSARPSPSDVAADGSALSWHYRRTAGRDFWLTLRPLEEGLWPVNEGPVMASFVDADGGVGTIDFEVPDIRVLAPIERPTEPATPTAPPTTAPSETPEPTETTLPSATPSPVASETGGPSAVVYLPVLENG